MQADRRRTNAPSGGTSAPVFINPPKARLTRPNRTRNPNEHRKIFLRTGVVPSASGSAYYEVPPAQNPEDAKFLFPSSSSLKISCSVHGPRPLPRTAAFSPNLLVTAHVKFAPFASRVRRGFVRDASERDLGIHLESALRGVVLGERWPKSAAEVVITILEGEEDGWWGENGGESRGEGGWGQMNVLAGCITVASAALVDAGIDCVDLVSGGVAAVVQNPNGSSTHMVLDPSPPEHKITAACVVGYLQSRDEITEVWMKGDAGERTDSLIDEAVKAAAMSRTVLAEAVKEILALKATNSVGTANPQLKTLAVKGQDIAMNG